MIDVDPDKTSIALGRAPAERRPPRRSGLRRQPTHADRDVARRPDRPVISPAWSIRPTGPAASATPCYGATSGRRAPPRSAPSWIPWPTVESRSATRLQSFFAAARPEVARSGRVVPVGVALGVGAQRLLPLVPDRVGVQVRGLLAVDGRGARSPVRRPCEPRRRHDPVRLQRRHRAARAALGGRGPASRASVGFGGSIPTGSTDAPSLEGVDIVVVRLLGGIDAGPRGSAGCGPLAPRPVSRWWRPGERPLPDPDLVAASTVPTGVAGEAHRYLAAGGPANVANLVRFLADTLLLTGVGFDPPVPVADVAVWPGAGLGRRRGGAPARSAACRRASSTGPIWSRGTRRTWPPCATRWTPRARTPWRCGPTRCAATPTAPSPPSTCAGSTGWTSSSRRRSPPARAARAVTGGRSRVSTSWASP